MTERGNGKADTSRAGQQAAVGFRRLIAFQKAAALADAIFDAVDDLPTKYGYVRNQLLRSSFSVPSNLAEGYGRSAKGDYMRFIEIARGSLDEVDYQLEYAAKHKIIPEAKSRELRLMHDEAGRVLHGFQLATARKERSTWNRSGGGR